MSGAPTTWSDFLAVDDCVAVFTSRTVIDTLGVRSIRNERRLP